MTFWLGFALDTFAGLADAAARAARATSRLLLDLSGGVAR